MKNVMSCVILSLCSRAPRCKRDAFLAPVEAIQVLYLLARCFESCAVTHAWVPVSVSTAVSISVPNRIQLGTVANRVESAMLYLLCIYNLE